MKNKQPNLDEIFFCSHFHTTPYAFEKARKYSELFCNHFRITYEPWGVFLGDTKPEFTVISKSEIMNKLVPIHGRIDRRHLFEPVQLKPWLYDFSPFILKNKLEAVDARILLPLSSTPTSVEISSGYLEGLKRQFEAEGLYIVGIWHSHHTMPVFNSPQDKSNLYIQSKLIETNYWFNVVEQQGFEEGAVFFNREGMHITRPERIDVNMSNAESIDFCTLEAKFLNRANHLRTIKPFFSTTFNALGDTPECVLVTYLYDTLAKETAHVPSFFGIVGTKFVEPRGEVRTADIEALKDDIIRVYGTAKLDELARKLEYRKSSTVVPIQVTKPDEVKPREIEKPREEIVDAIFLDDDYGGGGNDGGD